MLGIKSYWYLFGLTGLITTVLLGCQPEPAPKTTETIQETQPNFAAGRPKIQIDLLPLEEVERQYNETPTDPKAILRYGMGLYDQENWAEAEDILSKLGEEDNPTHNSALYYLGHSQIAQNKLKESIKSFKILAEKPSIEQHQRAESYRELGYLQEELRQYDLAILNMEKSLELNPDQPYLVFAVGTHYGEIGKYSKAKEVFESSLQVAPDNTYRAAAHAALGKALSKLGEKEKAQKHLSTALELDPETPNAQELLNQLNQES